MESARSALTCALQGSRVGWGAIRVWCPAPRGLALLRQVRSATRCQRHSIERVCARPHSLQNGLFALSVLLNGTACVCCCILGACPTGVAAVAAAPAPRSKWLRVIQASSSSCSLSWGLATLRLLRQARQRIGREYNGLCVLGSPTTWAGQCTGRRVLRNPRPAFP